MVRSYIDYLSVRNSMGVSLGKTNVSSFTCDMLGHLYNDMDNIEERSLVLMGVCPFRVKARQSVLDKIQKYKDKDKSLLVVFNDLLGCRIICNRYPDIVEDEVTSIFYREKEDGYRAMHVSYQLDEYCYPIEVQYWLKEDVNFNTWSRKYAWKRGIDVELMSIIRREYDRHNIKTEEDFRSWLWLH